MKRISRFFRKLISSRPADEENHQGETTAETLLSARLQINESVLRQTFEGADDVVFRSFTTTDDNRAGVRGLVVYIDGMVNEEAISEQLLERMILQTSADRRSSMTNPLASLSVGDIKEADTFSDVINAVLQGQTAILLDGRAQAVLADTRRWEKRSLEDVSSEPTIRGPKEGFSETLRVNTTLLRRRIKDPALKIRSLPIGRRTQTQVAVVYIKDIVNPAIVEEVLRRLQAIDVDGILDVSNLEEYLEEPRPSFFPLLTATERPDRCYQGLLDGRVVILADGSSFALIIPSLLAEFFVSASDFYENPFLVSTLRLLRIATQVLSATLPSLYVAMISFHPELLPTSLALTIAATREDIPFPAHVEVFILLIGAEILVESAIRLPRVVGQTVGIVGGIILGEGAVMAGVASPVLVIVMALTLITAFTVPSPQIVLPIRMLRPLLLLPTIAFGLFGLMLASYAIFIHLLTLESFGMPYLSPFAPLRPSELDSTVGGLYRLPWWAQKLRPSFFRPIDRRMQEPTTTDHHERPNLVEEQLRTRRRRR